MYMSSLRSGSLATCMSYMSLICLPEELRSTAERARSEYAKTTTPPTHYATPAGTIIPSASATSHHIALATLTSPSMDGLAPLVNIVLLSLPVLRCLNEWM